LYSGNNVLIFKTDDKQSGLLKYEILERKKYNFFNKNYFTGTWREVESPYQLKDQKLQSDIIVRAYDKQGNFQTATISASSPNRLV
jgi:hypothetical protein